MASSDRDNADDTNVPRATPPASAAAASPRAALDEALGFTPLDVASPRRPPVLSRPRLGPSTERAPSSGEVRPSVRAPGLVKVTRPDPRARSLEPAHRGAAASALERPIVHPRARAALAPAPRPTEPPALPPPPAAPQPPPHPPAARGDEDEPIFESTLRGLTRARLSQLASARPAAPEAPLSAASTPMPAPDPEPLQPVTATHTVMRAPVSSLHARLSVVSLVLLFQAFLLPTADGAPWELVARPAEVTLQAMAALVLIAVVHLMPVRDRTRARLGVALGLLLAPFAFVALRHAVIAGAFDDGQPALEHLAAGALPTPALPALVALVFLPASLMALARRARPWALWTLAALGLGAATATLVTTPIAELFAALSDAPFLGDRVAAWLTLPLLLALPSALLVLAVPPLQRAATPLALSLWAAALVPLLALALFSARSDQWQLVLEPLKLVAFLAAISLYLSSALATSTPRA